MNVFLIWLKEKQSFKHFNNFTKQMLIGYMLQYLIENFNIIEVTSIYIKSLNIQELYFALENKINLLNGK